MRLFVAVRPPPEVVDVLGALDRPATEGVRWTAPAQWHVTLRFLGEVADGSVDAAEEALGAVAVGLEPVVAVVGDRVERFGRAVAHVRVDGFTPWATAVAGGFVGAGIGPPPDDRPFRGHVTVARARGRSSVAAVAGARLPQGPRSWMATELALVRSRLGPGGAAYEDLVVERVGSR